MVVDATEGETILDVALANGINIEHACENPARVRPAIVLCGKVLTAGTE